MPDIKIRVGAVGDASLSTVFSTLVDATKKARAQVQAEFDKLSVDIPVKVKKGVSAAGAAASEDLPKAVKKGTDAAEKEYAKLAKEAERWHKQMVRDAEKAMADEVKAAERAGAAKVRIAEQTAREEARIAEKGARDNARAIAQGARTAERDHASANRSAMAGFNAGARVIGRIGSAALGAGERFGGDVLRGYGVNTDLASMFTANNSLEAASTKISNAGYMSNTAGANGTRQDPRAIAEQVRKVSTETAFDPNKAIEGLDAFVGKTGDLETGRAILKDMAVLSRATGTEFQDMVSAAADVSNNLGDIPNKGEAINKVMRVIAGEGKLGAVEIKDLATQMAKVAAAAGQIEGDAGENIALLGAFAQEARQRGGAASATQAATSVQGLVNTFKTPARAAAFKAATGQDVFNKQGMMRSPQELLMEALNATGMDPAAFKKIFANVSGGRAVEGFATIYRQAGGGQAGAAAVTAEFDRLKKAALDDAEIMESFRRSMATAEAQAQTFNNSLATTAAGLQDQLTPAVVQLAPALLGLAATTARVIEWMVGREAQVKAEVGVAGAAVDTDMSNTGKQLGQGYILAEQKKKNEEDEQLARAAMNKAVAETGGMVNKDGSAHIGHDAGVTTGDKVGAALDWTNPISWVQKAMGGKGAGEGAIASKEAKQAAREEQAQKAVESWDAIHKTNQRVEDLLREGLIIKKMPAMGSAPGSAAPLPSHNPGASNGPEAKVVHE